jgi:hypothetical protein
VTGISEPLPHSYIEGVNTVIEVGSLQLGVAETLEGATTEINAHRPTPI